MGWEQLGADPEFTNFEATTQPVQQVEEVKGAFQQFGSTPAEGALEQRLSQVLRPEEHGKEAIQVDVEELPKRAPIQSPEDPEDTIYRVGGLVNSTQSPEVGSTFSDLFDMGVNVLSAKVADTQVAMTTAVPEIGTDIPSPDGVAPMKQEQIAKLEVKPFEPHAPGVT